MTRRMVFDVESIGLHGEGWAVGYVLLNGSETEDEGWAYCLPDRARGTAEGRAWVRDNCGWAWGGGRQNVLLEHGVPAGDRVESPELVRLWFWDRWRSAAMIKCQLWADVPWPVEARFLGQCVEDVRPESGTGIEAWARGTIEPSPRGCEGPYPLLDVRSYTEALVGPVPPGDDVDLPGGSGAVLVHHPLADARLSANKLLRVERVLQKALPK